MWKVNAGGMQTTSNMLRGKWQRGMAKINLSFLKLGRTLGPIIKPLVDFVGLIAGCSIDFLLNSIILLIDALNYLANIFNVIFGGIVMGLGKLSMFFGGGSNVYDYGKAMYDKGTSGLNETSNQQTQNNSITFNIGGSNMNEDDYLIFSNRILDVIG